MHLDHRNFSLLFELCWSAINVPPASQPLLLCVFASRLLMNLISYLNRNRNLGTERMEMALMISSIKFESASDSAVRCVYALSSKRFVICLLRLCCCMSCALFFLSFVFFSGGVNVFYFTNSWRLSIFFTFFFFLFRFAMMALPVVLASNSIPCSLSLHILQQQKQQHWRITIKSFPIPHSFQCWGKRFFSFFNQNLWNVFLKSKIDNCIDSMCVFYIYGVWDVFALDWFGHDGFVLSYLIPIDHKYYTWKIRCFFHAPFGIEFMATEMIKSRKREQTIYKLQLNEK